MDILIGKIKSIYVKVYFMIDVSYVKSSMDYLKDKCIGTIHVCGIFPDFYHFFKSLVLTKQKYTLVLTKQKYTLYKPQIKYYD